MLTQLKFSYWKILIPYAKTPRTLKWYFVILWWFGNAVLKLGSLQQFLRTCFQQLFVEIKDCFDTNNLPFKALSILFNASGYFQFIADIDLNFSVIFLSPNTKHFMVWVHHLRPTIDSPLCLVSKYQSCYCPQNDEHDRAPDIKEYWR